jgi:hypothetical protein
MNAIAVCAEQSGKSPKSGGTNNSGDKTMRSEVVPFPLIKRSAWISDKLDKASGYNRRRSAEKYLDKRIEDRVESLRRMGISEDLIEKDVAPVRRIFNNMLAGSVWPDEPGYSSSNTFQGI